MTHRTARVGELIRHELSTILAREHSFGNVFVTVHQADVAADLKNCTIHIGLLGGDESKHGAVIDKLNRAAGAIQRSLYRRVTLKSSPRLFFKLDRSAERGVRIVNAMEQLPAPSQESDQPIGKFRGNDGLDHRWEADQEPLSSSPSKQRKSGQFNTPLNEESDSENEDE